MKIFTDKLSKIINKSVNKTRYIKTEPYPADSFQITQKLEAETSALQKLRNLFGFRTKLNPKTFADGSHTPQKPFLCSRQAADLSNEYLKNNYLSENQKIIDGFRDAGGGANFDRFGKALYAKREVITIDRELDVYLRNAISYVKQNTAQMSEKKKLKFIYNLMLDISGDAQKAVKSSELLGNCAAGEEKLLGKIFEHGAAVCRHKSIMFKILADEAGIKTRILRGNLVDLFGDGRHVWNEVKLQDGSKFLIDIQNSKMINLQNAAKNPKLGNYFTENNHPVYYK